MKNKEELEKEEMVIDNKTPKKCPKCHQWFLEYPAVSRRDNSYICSTCGRIEAMEDFINSKKERKDENVDWNYFDKFKDLMHKYMPNEGETLASQIVTAINKLIYKWYNDGDVYDNVNSGLNGWANDLSSYANWLYKYAPGDVHYILKRIYDINKEDDYEVLLKELADYCLNENFLESLEGHKQGTIYDCDGPFKFKEYNEDEEDEYLEESKKNLNKKQEGLYDRTYNTEDREELKELALNAIYLVGEDKDLSELEIWKEVKDRMSEEELEEYKEELESLEKAPYDFVANNYYKMDIELLKEITRAAIYLVDNDEAIEKELKDRIIENIETDYKVKVTITQPIDVDYEVTDYNELVSFTQEDVAEIINDNIETSDKKVEKSLMKYFKEYTEDICKDIFNSVSKCEIITNTIDNTIKCIINLDKDFSNEEIKYCFDDFIKDIVIFEGDYNDTYYGEYTISHDEETDNGRAIDILDAETSYEIDYDIYCVGDNTIDIIRK